MLNQAVLVGRLKYISVDFIELAVNKKDEPKEYYLVPVTLSESLAGNINKYCKKNDLIGIRGSLATKNGELIIMAEKVTFLSNMGSISEGGD